MSTEKITVDPELEKKSNLEPKGELPTKPGSLAEPKQTESEQDAELSRLKEDNERLQREKDSLAGIVSGKDKKTKEVSEELEEVRKQVTNETNRSKLYRELAADNDIPDHIKTTLVEELEGAQDIALEDFEERKVKYLKIHNDAILIANSKTRETLSKKPEETLPDDWKTKLQKAKESGDLDQILNL